MSLPAGQHNLAVVDVNRLRRAGIAGLLREWAQSHDLGIEEVSPDRVLSELDGSKPWRMVVVSIGGESLGDAGQQTFLKVLRALVPDARIVVMSDREDATEIVAAWRISCSGYLPTSMEPALALQALSFILSGGTYFPPSAMDLLQLQPERGGSPSSSSGRARSALRPVRSPHEEPSGPDEAVSRMTEELELEAATEARSAADEPTPDLDAGDEADCDFADGDGVDDEELDPTATERPDGLTHRQHQVLLQLRRGQPNKVIARELGVTEGTVKVHVRQIMRKLGAANRTQAAVLCEREHVTVAPEQEPRQVGKILHRAGNRRQLHLRMVRASAAEPEAPLAVAVPSSPHARTTSTIACSLVVRETRSNGEAPTRDTDRAPLR